MDYKYLFLIIFGFLFLNLVSAINITSCQGIDSSYLNESLVLQNDLNESVLADYNACFYLEDDFSGANLTIDCNFHTISITANNVSLDAEISDIFANYWEEETEMDPIIHAFSLDSLTFKNCNFDLEAYVYYDSEDDANYEYGVSVLELSGADGNVYVNEINIIDSNMYVEGQGISFEDFILDSLDMNFYGSYFEPVEVDSEYELDYEPNFIDLENVFLGTLTINDLTDGNFDYINSFVKVTNKLERYDYDSCNIQIDSQTDLNLLILQNVSLDFLNVFDMEYYADVYGICDPITYDDFSVLRDSNFQIIFDNVDINTIGFKYLNLNITEYENLSPISLEPLVLNPGNAFLKLTNNSDINNIFFEASNVNLNAGSLVLLQDNNDLDLIMDLNDLNIFDILVGDTGNANIITSLYSNYNDVTINNLNSEGTKLTILQNIDSNFNYFNVFDSYFDTKAALFFFVEYYDDFLDINFYNSQIIIINNNPISFYDAEGLFSNSIDYLEISNLDLNTDENIFSLNNTTIGELILTDSNIYFNNSYASFGDIDSDSNIQSGSIYNNIFSANFEYVAYADANNLFNVDFNTVLTEDQTKRSAILDDDANYIGGNLYLDENGNNALFEDCTEYLYPGIFDCSLDLGMSTGESIFDYYPLVEYSLNYLPDISVYGYDYLSDFFFNNGNLDFNVFYTNLGNSSTDINIWVYVVKSLEDLNLQKNSPHLKLTSLVTVLPDNNYNSFFRYSVPADVVCMGENCGGPGAGLYSIYILSLLNNELCTLDIDSNCENNYLFEENIFAFYDDGNYLLEIYDIDVNQNVEGNIRVDCNIINIGDINSNLDYNVFLGYGDYNYVSHEYEFEFTQDNISESISAFGSKIVSFNVDVNAEDYNFRCEVADLGYSDGQYIKEFTFNSIDSNSAIDLVAESVDLNSYNVNLGEYIDLNFVYSNLGPDNATDFNLICGVYSNDVFLDNLFNENISESFFGTDYYVVSLVGDMAGSYDFNCYLISNVEADSNMLNNFFTSDTLTVSEGIDSNYIDVSIINVDVNDDYIEIGDSINVTCDFNNLSTLDTNYDLNAEIFVVDSWSLIENHSGTLLENTSSSWSFSATTDSLSAGDYNLRCIIDANEDINLNNNSEILTISVYDVPGENTFVDLNASLSSSSYVTKGNVIEMNLTIANDGNKATDSNYIIYFYTDNELEESCTINRNNVLAPNDGAVFGCEIDSSDISIGAHTLKGVVNYQGVDNNSDNNSSETLITVQYVDLNVSNMQISDDNVISGETFDMNFVLTNSGDANTDQNYIVQFYLDSNEIEFCYQNINSVLPNGNNIVYTCDNVDTTGLTLGDHNLIGLVTYLGYDVNSENNSNLLNILITEAPITYVDLNAYSLDSNVSSLLYGESLDINFGYQNVGNADANADYNIVYYIDSVEKANYLISDNLLFNTIDYNSYVWASNILGDVNVYVCITYSETEYLELNNCVQETYHVYYRDISVINAEVISDVIYGQDLNISVDLNNLGDFNSNDVNVYVYVLDSQNSDNNLINPVSILDFDANDSWNITSSFSNFNLTLNDLNILVEVITTETDYNTENHSSILFGNVAQIYYKDLNVYSVEFEDITPVYGSNVNLDLNIENNGNFDANDVTVLVYFIENSNTDNNFLYSTIEDFAFGETTTLTITWEDINILDVIDIYVELEVLNDYNELDNNRLFSTAATVGYVDLNSYIEVPDVNAGYTIDINCIVTNLGNLPADSYTISYYLNGILQDSNTLTNLLATESYAQTFSFSSNVKVDDQNLGCVVSFDSDFNNLNDSYFIDRNIGADSDVDLSIEAITFTGALNTLTEKIIDCNIGNVGSENAELDYNVLFYVNNVLTDFNLISEDLNINNYNLISFSWTPKVNGTYTFKCLVDYNVNNYLGFDQNLDNDYLTTNATINYVAPTNNSSSSGGSNISGTPKINAGNSITFIYNPLNTYSNIYLDSVDLELYSEFLIRPNLKLNIFPNIPNLYLISNPDIKVLKYFEFVYSGEQDNLKNVKVNFSIRKSELIDPTKIKLARYHNSQWVYYDVVFEDMGYYYKFTANIPGFSYFAIVDYNVVDEEIEVVVPKDENVFELPVVDENKVIVENISIKKSFKPTYNQFIIGLGIIAILILLVLLLVNLHKKRKGNNYAYNFKLAQTENKILEKKLKEKTGYDL